MTKQPAAPRREEPTAASEDEALIARIVARTGAAPDVLIEILHAVLHERGRVDPALVPLIAAHLNLSRADVHGTLSFYPDFARQAAARHTVKLCRAEACQAVGAARLAAHARARLGCDFDGTSRDGAIALEAVYCLGNCACGPALLLDDELHGRVDGARFDALLAELAARGSEAPA